MKNAPREIDLLTKEKRGKIAQDIVAFFETERGEEIGLIAAGEMLDFFVDALGPEIYNKAMNDAKTAIKQGCESMEIDVDALMKR